MVENVKQPETQDTPKQTTTADKTIAPTTRDNAVDVGQKFLQDVGDQYLGPNKTDATKGKDIVDDPKSEMVSTKKPEETPSRPDMRKADEPSLLEFSNPFGAKMKPEDFSKGLPEQKQGGEKPFDQPFRGEMPLYQDRYSDKPYEREVKTLEQIQQEDEEWERQRIPVIEERSRDIKGMKDLKLEPTAKAEIDPTPSKSEIETMGVKAEDAAKVKAEVSKNGMTPEKALTDSMKSARVVGIDNPQIDWKQNLDFSTKAFKALKDGGATHAVFDVPESLKPLLDEFNKTGIVDRTKLNLNAKTDYDAVSMQAALNSGLKIVSGGTEAFIDNSRSEQRAKAVQDIIEGDKNAKVVLVSSGEHLASGNDRQGNPSTIQRLRDAGLPVTTAKVTDADSYDDRTAVLGRTLNAPVAIPLDKSPAVASLKAGFVGEHKLSSWDINIIMPDVKTR